MKTYLLNWLKNNWKHVTVAVVNFVLTMLLSLGKLNAGDYAIITGILNALGLSLTTNSGTSQRVVTIKNANAPGGEVQLPAISPTASK